MELISRFSLGEILRKMHTESRFSGTGQQELPWYLGWHPRQQLREYNSGCFHQLIFQLPHQVLHLISPPLLPLPPADVSQKL